MPAPSGEGGSYCGDAKVDPGEDCDEGVIFIKDSSGGRRCCNQNCKFIGKLVDHLIFSRCFMK